MIRQHDSQVWPPVSPLLISTGLQSKKGKLQGTKEIIHAFMVHAFSKTTLNKAQRISDLKHKENI